MRILLTGATGQVSLNVYGTEYTSRFVGSVDDNTGYLYLYPIASAGWIPLRFCPQSDGTFAIYMDSSSGVGTSDRYIIVVCPNDVSQRVFIDNGDQLADFASQGCLRDTLLYDPII